MSKPWIVLVLLVAFGAFFLSVFFGGEDVEDMESMREFAESDAEQYVGRPGDEARDTDAAPSEAGNDGGGDRLLDGQATSDRESPPSEPASATEALPINPDWHPQALRDIEHLLYESQMGDDSYLMELACEGTDCRGMVYFSGADNLETVESMLDTLNESDSAVGVAAGRPALLESIRSDANGITADFVVREGAELHEPEVEQVMEAMHEFHKRHGFMPEGVAPP